MTDNTDWWFNEVEGTFGFLVAELGFEVSERYRHFKGNYIAYARSDATLAIECPPDWNDLWDGSPFLARMARGQVSTSPICSTVTTRHDHRCTPVTRGRSTGRRSHPR